MVSLTSGGVRDGRSEVAVPRRRREGAAEDQGDWTGGPLSAERPHESGGADARGVRKEVERHAGAGAEIGTGVGAREREAVDDHTARQGAPVLGAAVYEIRAEDGGAARREERWDSWTIAEIAPHPGRVEVSLSPAARIEDERTVVGRRIVDRDDGLNIAPAAVHVAPLRSAVAAVLAVLVRLEFQPVVRVLGVQLVEEVDRSGRAEELADDRGEPYVAPTGKERRLATPCPDDPQQPERAVRTAEDELAAGTLDVLRVCPALAGRERRGQVPPHGPQPLGSRGHCRDLLTREEVLDDQETVVVVAANVRRGKLVDHQLAWIVT